MQLTIKHYDELTTDDLFAIFQARMEVFVVEQKCTYQDLDDIDKQCWHVWLHDESGVVAYCRAIGPGVKFEEASIGRVLSLRRREGWASTVVREALKLIQEKWGSAQRVRIEAQTYVQDMYEKLGFVADSDVFMEVEIPHILMVWHAPATVDSATP